MLPDGFLSGNTVGLDPEEAVELASAGWMVEASRSRSLMTTGFCFVFRCAIFQEHLWKARPLQISVRSTFIDSLNLLACAELFKQSYFVYFLA